MSGNFFLFKSKKSFTLLEVIIAIFVISLGIIGALSLIGQTLGLPAVSSDRLIAAYLGQEGIEIVRNLRDSNRLSQRENPALPWNNGLAEGDWEADYNDSNLMVFAGRFLRIDGGFYNYDSGTETKFKRKITISPLGEDILKVSVQVQWQEKGQTNQIVVQENLYNWR